MYPDRVGWATLGFPPPLFHVVSSYKKSAWAWDLVNASSIGAQGELKPSMYHSQFRTLGPIPLMEEESLEMVLVM